MDLVLFSFFYKFWLVVPFSFLSFSRKYSLARWKDMAGVSPWEINSSIAIDCRKDQNQQIAALISFISFSVGVFPYEVDCWPPALEEFPWASPPCLSRAILFMGTWASGG